MRNAHTTLERIGIAIVFLHALVVVAHSAAHFSMYIYMSLWQNAYILSIIVVLPVVSGILLWRRARNGFLLLFFSMLGALLFGGHYHFIAPGPDNVAWLGHHPWAFPFQVSAILLLVLETAGAFAGLFGFLRVQSE